LSYASNATKEAVKFPNIPSSPFHARALFVPSLEIGCKGKDTLAFGRVHRDRDEARERPRPRAIVAGPGPAKEDAVGNIKRTVRTTY